MNYSEACQAVGIEPREVPHDGRWHRVPVAGKSSSNSTGRILWFPDGEGGFCWNHSEDDEHKKVNFWVKDRKQLSPEEIQQRKVRIAEEMRKAEEERKREAAKAAEDAKRILEAAKPAGPDHPYLVRKGIKPHIAKVHTDGRLLIPVRVAGKLTSLQYIGTDGEKRFHPGGIIAGGGCLIGKPGNKLVIAEGFATASCIHEATGLPVVVAFNAGNLKAIAEQSRQTWPDAEIVIAGDDDCFHADGTLRPAAQNVGVAKATEAAKLINGLIAVPAFPEPRQKQQGTDFQDLCSISGADAVTRCIEAAQPAQQDVLQDVLIDGPISEHGDQWPEPVPFGDLETPEIKPDLLPEPLATFCTAVTDSCQTPPGMAVMMALSAVATCLQKRFEVAPFGEGYTEPINVMTCTALDPASRKSAVVKLVTEPLTAWEMQQSDLLKDRAAKVGHERDMVIKSIESIKSTASKASATDEDRREALTEIRRLEDTLPPEVIVPRLWVDDVTVERLQNLMADNNERMALISAEGGIFEVLAGLYSGGKSNINIVLQSHAGEPVRVERQGR